MLFREGDRFPGVLEKAKQRLIGPAYEEFAAWLGRHARGRDVEATATVGLGAIVQYRAAEAILGEPPGGMGEERFLGAWVDMLAGGLSWPSSPAACVEPSGRSPSGSGRPPRAPGRDSAPSEEAPTRRKPGRATSTSGRPDATPRPSGTCGGR